MVLPPHIFQNSPLIAPTDPSDPPTSACWQCLAHGKKKRKAGDRSFFVAAPWLWKSLPESVDTFKMQLKTCFSSLACVCSVLLSDFFGILPCVAFIFCLDAFYVLCKVLWIALLLKCDIQINLPCLALPFFRWQLVQMWKRSLWTYWLWRYPVVAGEGCQWSCSLRCCSSHMRHCRTGVEGHFP